MNNSHCIPLLFLLLLTKPLFGYQPNEISFKKNEAKLNIQLHDINSFSGQNLQKITPHNSKITFLTENDTIRNRKKRQANKKQVASSDEYIDQVIKDINKKRHVHNVPLLKKDAKITKFAKKFIDGLFAPSGPQIPESAPYGVIFSTCDLNDKKNPVDEWYSYSKGYDYSTYELGYPVSLFTQLVWKSSKRIGCGVGQNKNYRATVCFFSPSGNTLAKEYTKNVLKPN